MNETHVRSFTSLIVIGAFAALVGCSNSNSGGTGGAGTIATSVDTTKNLSALSAADLTTYCHDLETYEANAYTAAQAKAFSCALTAAFEGGGTVAGCETAYQACESSTADAGTTVDAGTATDPCTTLQQQATQCNATISDIDTCIEEQAALIKTVAAESAQTVCTPSTVDAATTSPTPTCDSIKATCPTIDSLF